MEYRTFLEMTQQEIAKKVGANGIVRINHTIKNNSTQKDSITIHYEGENVSPAIYLDYFYQRYQEGMPVTLIADLIFMLYRQNKGTGREDISFYLNFESIKNRIFCKVINYEKNLPMLTCIPHERFLDLAIVYYCEVECESFGFGTILVQYTHTAYWGISQSTLHEIAVENTRHGNPYDFIEISELVKDMTGIVLDCGMADKVPMYVLTNEKKCFGAVNLCFPEVLEAIARNLGADFYVLPSSIHECMIVPVTVCTAMKGADYQEMVEEINGNFVMEEEILGESVYRYFREEQKLRIVAQHREDAE